MNRCLRISCLVLSVLVAAQALYAQPAGSIIVDAAGKGRFRTIQAAVNSLPDSSREQRTIFIRKGVYNEKLMLAKSGFILQGEDSATTIITQSIARDEWRCTHDSDWGVATVNITGNDITLRNLTISNQFGFDNKASYSIDCPLDTLHRKKTIDAAGHQMALRTNSNTRLKAIHCHFTSWAGDTVSPWNVVSGMFYFQRCTMEGGVDFYCPRGWAYAEDCHFIAHTGLASIWHDGSANADSKTVLRRCSFSGFDGFRLGRYHKDAQFYLLDCRFDANMANQDIYLVATNNILRWGRRIYYFNCHRQGEDFSWYANNLANASGSPKAEDINAAWTFNNNWNPAE